MTEKFEFADKTENRFPDPGGQGSGQLLLLPLILIKEHPHANSRYRVEVLITAQVFQLKHDFQRLLNVAAENQKWSFKNRKLNDMDTIQMIGIKKHEIIVCQNTGVL
ncbi:hypothetical protein BsWGS_12420 [Bradybaena similaris]